jgi:RIO1 family
MASRSTFGRQAIVGQRAKAEFGALARLPAARCLSLPGASAGHRAAARVHRAADETAAAKRAKARPGDRRVGRAVGQAGVGARRPGREGFAHRDLLAYNLLVRDGRLVMIAFPWVVDVIANRRGAFYLTCDAENMGRWFAARGLVGVRPEPQGIPAVSIRPQDTDYGLQPRFRRCAVDGENHSYRGHKLRAGIWAYGDSAHTQGRCGPRPNLGRSDDPGDWDPVIRTLRDGHTETRWAADARLGW